jgi:hypothetical protein
MVDVAPMNAPVGVDRFAKLSRAAVADEIANRDSPFILTNVVTEWPAFSCWSPSYLGERIGDRQVKVGVSHSRIFHYGSKEHPPTRTRELPFNEALRQIAGHDGATGEHLYIMEQTSAAGHSVADVYPELANDFAIPAAIEKEKLRQVNLWIGTAGNVTPLHYDAANNFLAQIKGRKRIHLFHPSQSDLLYPNATRQNDNNTSQVLLLKPDFDKHPRFKEAVARECILQPGEMLYIPPHWWHHVESLDVAISLNFWWKPRLAQFLHPMGIQSIYYHHDRGELAHAQDVLDLSEFKDLADVASYCLSLGHKCIAMLFAKAELGHRRANGEPSGTPASAPWQDLIRRAEQGDDLQLDHEHVASFLRQLTNERTAH